MRLSRTLFRRVAPPLLLALAVLCVAAGESRANQSHTKRVVRAGAARRHATRRSGRRRARTRLVVVSPSSVVYTQPSSGARGVVVGSRDVDPTPGTVGPFGPTPPASSSSGAPQITGTPSPKTIIAGDVLNGKVLNKPVPPYPPIAKAARAQGMVQVQVLIDEEGNVIEAKAISGHPLLQRAAVEAARGAKFTPTRLSGQPVRVSGVITYNFVLE